MSLKDSIADVFRHDAAADWEAAERESECIRNETYWEYYFTGRKPDYWDGLAEVAPLKRAEEEQEKSVQALQTLLTTLTTADETKSTRIPFMGSEDFSTCKEIVVSFPGAYGVAWVFLTRSKHLATSCVFLPDENANGFGEHVYIPTACILPGEKADGSRKDFYIPIPILGSANHEADGCESCFQLMPRNAMAQCFCFDLYGKQMEFGCKWYQAWMENTFRAKRTGKELIVVTKADGTLGNSQKGEVRFLEKRGFKFTFRNISDFAKSHSYLSENAKSLLREIAGS